MQFFIVFNNKIEIDPKIAEQYLKTSIDNLKNCLRQFGNQNREIIVKFVEQLKFSIMNSSELKLDLFRKIDRLDNREIKKIYNNLLSILDTASSDKTSLSPELMTALDEALDASKKGQVYTHEEVMQKTKDKYPNLF